MRAWQRTTRQRTTSRLSSLALSALALLAFAGVAQAEVTIDGEPTILYPKGRKIIVAVDVTMDASGTVNLTGTLNGQLVDLTKKFKAKKKKQKTGESTDRTIRFTVDPRKFGLRRLDEALKLDFDIDAREGGDEGGSAQTEGRAALPLPLMIVPGTTNELTSDGTYTLFRDRLNTAAGGPWLTRGSRASIKIVNYKSLSIGIIPRETFGQQVARATQKVIKKSIFSRADIVSHSMGGWIVRQAMVPVATKKKKKTFTLDGLVRHSFFMGVAQSGTPVTYLANAAIEAADAIPGVSAADIAEPLLANVDNPLVDGLADLLLNEAFIGVVESFFPTYPFATVPNPLGEGTVDVGLTTLTAFPGPPVVPPLTDLNDVAPDPTCSYHAMNYTDVIGSTGDLRTVVGVDLTAFLAGGGADLATVGLVNGPGDGLAPWTSALMETHPAWNAVLIPVDLGPGLHSGVNEVGGAPAYWNDTRVWSYILDFVQERPAEEM